MANSQGYSSSSEPDTIIIDLDFRSEADTENGAAASTAIEVDHNNPSSRTRHADSDSSKSERPSEYLPADDVDLMDDIFHRTERSESDENLSTNNDHDDVDMSLADDNPLGVREMDDDDKDEDSDAENRLIIQEEIQDDQLGASEKEKEETEDEKGTVLQRMTSSPEHSFQFELSETFLDNLNPQEESQDLDEEQEENDEEGIQKRETEKVLEDNVGDEKEADISGGPSEKEADISGGPSSISESGHIELSETFLDNLNPQDDSQDLHEDVEERDNDQVVGDTDRDQSSPHGHGDEAAASHTDDTPRDTSSSLGRQNTILDEPSSPHGEQSVTMEKATLPHLQQSITPCEASVPFVRQNNTADEVLPPLAQQNNIVDDTSFPHKDNLEEEEQLDNVNKDIASPSHEQKDGSRNDAASSQEEENISPKKVASSILKQDTILKYTSSPDAEKEDDLYKVSPSEQECELSNETAGTCVQRDSEQPMEKLGEVFLSQDIQDRDPLGHLDNEETSIGNEGKALFCLEDKKAASPTSEEKDCESAAKGDIREEGEYSSTSSSPSVADDVQGEDASDVLQISADDLEMRDDDFDNKTINSGNSGWDEKAGDGDQFLSSSPIAKKDHSRNDDGNSSAPVLEVNSDGEEVSGNNQVVLNKETSGKGEENSCVIGDEDGIDIIETSVDLDDRDEDTVSGTVPLESSSKESPVLGVTRINQKGAGEKEATEGDSRTVQADDDDSEDDVQIIECPPQHPIDTLIVDDDDDDDIVPASSVSSKAPLTESSRTSKKKRTVEHDGHDLRIVIRDERHEKDDADRRHRRRERERREERRSDSHRRSESDRKSSDRSSRRRYHRSRSHSRERRRKRTRSRSRSRERTSRRRRHRDRSRDKSADRERSSHRKRRRDHSREHRHKSRSKSHSPKHGREDSWDKENRDDGVVTELSRNKRRRYRQHEDKHRESQEEEGSKTENSPPAQRSSQRHGRTWSPSDTFLKDPSDSPSPLRTAGEKSDDESEEVEGSVEVLEQNDHTDKREERGKPTEKETEVISVDVPVTDTQGIPIPKPEDIPIPETVNIPIPAPQDIPFPQPESMPEPEPLPVLLQPELIFQDPPLPPVPDDEPMENPPEPPPLPARWPDGLPPKGEGLLPTPIRRKAALEEAGAVYDPAHPTDDDNERFIFHGVPNSAHPPPEIMGGPPPPQLPGQLMNDGTFVPASEGSLLGPPPHVPMQQVTFNPHRPMLMNHMVLERPPFSNGPFPVQVPGPPITPRFRMQMRSPSNVIQLQNQFGQGLPPGPPPPPQAFPGQINERFEDGPPRPPPQVFPGQINERFEDGQSRPPPQGFPGQINERFEDGPPRPPPQVFPGHINERFEDGPPRPPPQGFPGQINERFEDGPPGPPPQGFPGQINERFEDGPPRPPPQGFPGQIERFEDGPPRPPPQGFPGQINERFEDGPPRPPPQGFPGHINERFEDGPPRPPVGQFSVSVHSGMPEMPNMVPPPGHLPPDIHLMSHPPPPDIPIQENRLTDDNFDNSLSNLVVAQNLLTVIKDHNVDGEPGSFPPSSVFKLPPPPPVLLSKSPNMSHLSTEVHASVDRSEDSTEVMDMDMSPLDEECELQLPTPPEMADAEQEGKGKKSKPLAAIDLRAITNAIKKLTQLPTDDVPASAVELTNKEKYMKKLHLQERVVDEVKQALRPFYNHKKIDKEEYKTILRKAVPKVCHSKSGDINPQKIQQLVEGYVSKFQKQRQYTEQKVKAPKTASNDKGKANGERAKPAR